MATPGSEVRFRTSATKRRGPSHSWTSFSSVLIFSLSPSAMRRAAFRHMAASWRSICRTPASRVYSRMIVRSPLTVNVSCERLSPCAFSCFGTRYFLAIPSFSSSV